MKSLSQQTNSLINVGDIIIIKTPLPINPEEVKILGYEVVTQDIVDFRDWVGAYYSIVPISEDATTNINALIWINLGKDIHGESESFVAKCGQQEEPFYIYFKFIKLSSKGQIVNITKVNLKIQDSDAKEKLKEKFPFYFQSIFGEDSPNNEEILTWQYNVLQKVSGDEILPHYIEKDKDFSTFWGWITHFFAIIVHFGRKFKKIFEDILANLDDIGEFMKQKGYYRDSRVQINQDLKIYLTEELIQNFVINTRLINGYPVETSNYIFSGYLPIQEDSIIIFKVGGYNENSDTYVGTSVSLDLSYFYKGYVSQGHSTVNLSATEAKNGKRIRIPKSEGERICYLGISYPKLGNANLPLYIQVFAEGEGIYFLENRNKEDIFGVYKDFRKRGTQKSENLIKKILETKKEDGFYANYLNINNVGWFLNKNCPINRSLVQKIQIDSLIAKEKESLVGGGLKVEFLDQYLILNQNTSLIIKWKGNSVIRVDINIEVYDKNGELLSATNPILGDWVSNSTDRTIEPDSQNNISLIPKFKDGKYQVELPINIIKNSDYSVFSWDSYNKENFLNDSSLYVFTKYSLDGTKEAFYIKIKDIKFIGNSSVFDDNNNLINLEVGLQLTKLPFSLGFLNIKKYFLCCFKNNGTYSDEEAKEIINHKILPYNGYRLFMNNSIFKDDISVPLELVTVDFNKNSRIINLKIKGGVTPYRYKFDNEAEQVSYLQDYTKTLSDSEYGIHYVVVTDSVGNKLKIQLSCFPYNSIDYKFKIELDIQNNVNIQAYIFGGSEASYTLEYGIAGHYNSMVIPPKTWVNLAKVGFTTLQNKDIVITDNIANISPLTIHLFDLMKDMALDIYDIGEGEQVN